MTDRKIDTTTMVVDPFNTDHQRRWSWPSLGKALLNAAENHAKARGFGMMDLNGKRYSWVLSRLAIEMPEMPKVYDEIAVSTWIESIYRLFTNRNFAVKGTDGRTFGYARSIWAMIDYESRQPAQLEQMEGEVFQHFLAPQEPCPIDPQGRVKPLHDEDFVKAHHAKYSDIDMNGHVNSIKYIEHIMDLFPMDCYADASNLHRLEIAYMAESRFGDLLSFFRRKVSDTTYEVEVRKDFIPGGDRGTPVVRALLNF